MLSWVGEPGRRNFYWQLACAGLLLFAGVFTMFGLLIALAGDPKGLLFVQLSGILTFAIAALAWTDGKLGLFVAIAWAMLNVGVHAPFAFVGFGYVNSFFDFSLALGALVGLSLAAFGGVVALAFHIAGATPALPAWAQRSLSWTILVVLVGFLTASAILHITGRVTVAAEDKIGVTNLDMKNTEFLPVELSIVADEPARLLIKNRDFTVHTFTIKEIGVNLAILPGNEQLVEVSAPGGRFQYVCLVPGHESMRGTLKVVGKTAR